MKITKSPQPFSSAVIDLDLPTSWQDMSAEDIVVWAKLATALPPNRAKIYYILHLLKLGHINITYAGLLVSPIDKNVYAILSPEQVAVAIEELDFLDNYPTMVIDVPKLGCWTVESTDLQGVEFRYYLMAENYFQAYLQTRDKSALLHLIETISGKDENDVAELEPWVEYLTVLWYTSVKGLFASLFPDLFKSSASGEPPTSEDMRQAMDAQIRALTGGDITKENLILSADTWRALTELNAKAREANEYRNHHV